MSPHPGIRDEDLHAFIDGELDTACNAEVADAAQGDAALMEQIAAFRADKAMLAEVYAPLIDKKLPAEWLADAQEQLVGADHRDRCVDRAFGCRAFHIPPAAGQWRGGHRARSARRARRHAGVE
jgi:anti-sigma factor RsiW